MLSHIKPIVISIFGISQINFIRETRIYEIFKRLYHLLRILEPPMRRKVFYMQACSTLQGLSNTFLVGLLAFLLAVIAAPDIIHDNKYVYWIYSFLGADDSREFIVFLAAITFVAVVVVEVANVILSLINQNISFKINQFCSIKLFNYYLSRHYEESVNTDMDLVMHHHHSVGGMVNSIISTSANIISAFVNIVVIVMFILSISPIISSIIVAATVSFYMGLYFLLKRRQLLYGEQQRKIALKRLNTLRQGILGYIEVVMRGKASEYIHLMRGLAREMLNIQIRLFLINTVPNKLLRMSGMFVLFAIVFYIVKFSDAESGIFVTIALLGGASIRLFPMIGRFYAILSGSLLNTAEYMSIMESLGKAHKYQLMPDRVESDYSPVKIDRELSLHNVWYSYKKDDHYQIRDMSLSIPVGKVVVLCGCSGAGKTTVAKLVSGLVSPGKGDVLIDGKSICGDADFCYNWRKSISYIPQSPFFMDASIAMNIAFELEESKINYAKIKESVVRAELEEVIDNLPEGLETRISSNTTLLSGGQLQRISIARAIYQDSTMLILDESTSALDAITEKNVLSTLTAMKSEMPILIIAHGPESVRQADKLLVIDHGKLIAEGDYNELMETSDLFRSLMYEYDNPESQDMEVE